MHAPITVVQSNIGDFIGACPGRLPLAIHAPTKRMRLRDLSTR
jgi:hypothetical protein